MSAFFFFKCKHLYLRFRSHHLCEFCSTNLCGCIYVQTSQLQNLFGLRKQRQQSRRAEKFPAIANSNRVDAPAPGHTFDHDRHVVGQIGQKLHQRVAAGRYGHAVQARGRFWCLCHGGCRCRGDWIYAQTADDRGCGLGLGSFAAQHKLA